MSPQSTLELCRGSCYVVERVDFKRARKYAWPPSQLSQTENLSVHVVLATERWSECRRTSRLHSKVEASEGPGFRTMVLGAVAQNHRGQF